MTLQTPIAYSRTKAKIDKLIERSKAKGFNGDLAITGKHVTVKNNGTYSHIPNDADIVMVEVTITGEAPCYAGYEFLARLDMVGDEWVIATPPGVESGIDRETLVRGYCAHCETNRANRRKLFLVRDTETGETVQVGSTCIKDFLGWDTFPVFLSTEDVPEEGRGGSNDEPHFTPSYVLRVALAVSDLVGGFRPRSFGWDSTVSGVMRHLFPARNQPTDHELLDALANVTDSRVDDVIETVRTALADDDGDFAQNLLAVLNADLVTSKYFGILIAALSTFERATKPVPEKVAEPVKPKEWIGQVGEKVTLTGTAVVAMAVEGYMPGSYTMLIVVANEDHAVKFYTTAAWADNDDVQRGVTLTVTGTVKKHDTYRDDKQTILTRVKGEIVDADA